MISGIAISVTGCLIGAVQYKNIRVESFELNMEQTVVNMDISIKVGSFEMVKSDEFKISAENFKEGSLKHEVKNAKLIIKDSSNDGWFRDLFDNDFIFLAKNREPQLTVYVKEGDIFENINIDVGIGEVCLKNIDFNNSKISCGTGKVSVSGKMTGNINVDNGIGEVYLNIYGRKSDYYIDADNGIGDISINGKRYNKSEFSKSAKNTIIINNGVGNIDIVFED